MANEPSEATQATVTHLLGELRHGSRHALDALLSLVYEELRILAHRQRQRWRGDDTMGTTVLVHELYLKLVKQDGVDAGSRAHFFAIASRAMRHILCNYARDRQAKKRGGEYDIVQLDSSVDLPAREAGSTGGYAHRLMALDEALARLEQIHRRRSRVVECRFFGGMTVKDTAAALDVSPRTVKRDWAAAQEWLRRELSPAKEPAEATPTLDKLATNALSPLLDELARSGGDEFRPGQRVGQYEIVATLGRGGMGVVYKAYDARLDRHVALKFLPSYLARGGTGRARLRSEARAVSALDHPNICTIYDIGELGDGRIFLALACYEGETLKQKIAGGPLPVADAIAITGQIAEALSAAHQRGIVHRDIKPSNVVITTEGRVKILDFGVAKLREEDSTGQEAAMGTLAYMSPEQLRGEAADAGSDLWSLGVVVYEILAGRRPFGVEGRQRLRQALRDGPGASLPDLRPGLPPLLVRIVGTCLQNDPEERYQDAGELLSELRALEMRAAGTSEPAHRVAVLPLTSETAAADEHYLADGIVEELGARLSAVSGLHVIARAAAMSYGESDKDPAQIGAELGAGTVVHGTVARSGDNVSITLQLADVTRSEPLWATEQDMPVAELENALGMMAWRIASELAVQVHDHERRQLARKGTESAAAYELYLKGRYFWSKRDRTNIQQARACFQEALDLDPVFAPAWAGLADAYCVLGGYMLLQPEDAYPRARAAAERALAIDDGLAEAHASLATILADHYWSWSAAGQHYRRALKLNPNYATARLWYAGYLRDLGEFDEALLQIRAARELDPLSTPIHAAEGITLYVARRYAKAVAVYRKLLEITPTFTYAYFLLALALAQERRYDEALASLRKADEWTSGTADVRGLSGYVLGMVGRHDEALAMLEALDDPGSQQYATPFHRAAIHVALGETERALQLLERALETRAKQVRLLRVEPMFDPIRDEPRFQALLEEVGLTDEAVADALAT